MKWEYLMRQIAPFDDDSTKELNQLGDEGWEAVSAWSSAFSGDNFVLLKRKK
jgi:hypothetical protein